MPMPFQPWRAAMVPASYGGAGFKVEVDGQASGRRNAVHEFPKQDVPWTEDMGRRARRWTITGYVIGPFYTDDRDALIEVLEAEGPATLVHPTLGEVQANVDEYAATERREQGGYCVFEMRFVEAGQQPDSAPANDTQAQVNSSASDAGAAAASSLDNGMAAQGGIGSDAVVGGPVASGSSTIGSSDFPING